MGVQARRETRLVRVDVPHARNRRLVEKNGLDRSPRFRDCPNHRSARSLTVEMSVTQFESIGPNIAPDLGEMARTPEREQEPKAPWIGEAEAGVSSAACKCPSHMRVHGRFLAVARQGESSGHSQVHDHAGARFGDDRQLLATPVQMCDPRALEKGPLHRGSDRGRAGGPTGSGANHVAALDVDRCNDGADEIGLEGSARALDFREFRHATA